MSICTIQNRLWIVLSIRANWFEQQRFLNIFVLFCFFCLSLKLYSIFLLLVLQMGHTAVNMYTEHMFLRIVLSRWNVTMFNTHVRNDSVRFLRICIQKVSVYGFKLMYVYVCVVQYLCLLEKHNVLYEYISYVIGNANARPLAFPYIFFFCFGSSNFRSLCFFLLLFFFIGCSVTFEIALCTRFVSQ